jgi:hypothetical protein
MGGVMIPSELVPTRTICSVLDEMRTCIKVLDFRCMAALIEEAQSYANRMEDGLSASRTASRIAWLALIEDTEKTGPDVDAAVAAIEKRWLFRKGRHDY